MAVGTVLSFFLTQFLEGLIFGVTDLGSHFAGGDGARTGVGYGSRLLRALFPAPCGPSRFFGAALRIAPAELRYTVVGACFRL